MKKLTFLALFIAFSASLFSQNKLTNALYALKNNELDKAKELIDAAMVDSVFMDKAATWYYAGNIYKELFKKNEFTEKQSPMRLLSANYFIKSVELDTAGTYQKSSRQNLKYIAETIYNHAASSFDMQQYPVAISNYTKYKELLSFAYPETNFTEKDIMFNLALATTYSKIAESDSTNRDMYVDKARELYQKVLELDSNNVSANYNIGIIYYNEGVDIVNNMDYSLDLEQLNLVQDRIIELFRESLPYMKKAYDLNPKRKETLIGLQGIYFSLNDIPKSEAYKKELEKLEEEESMEKTTPEDVEMQEE
tara:strand:+ start:1745 stop:2668 length:924 start_codon:yes stop_codon:yes gene_type:complete